MAYNPFDFFRRNQKTAFAALTIFVMFTFVLSFGQGDFFQWVPGWLGSFKNRGKDAVASEEIEEALKKFEGKKLAVFLDVDGNRHLAVTLEEDPAADLQRWHGRYLYFSPDEVEPR